MRLINIPGCRYSIDEVTSKLKSIKTPLSIVNIGKDKFGIHIYVSDSEKRTVDYHADSGELLVIGDSSENYVSKAPSISSLPGVISYCIICCRPRYNKVLIDDLIRKTTVPYEILVWINIPDTDLTAYINKLSSRGIPIRIVGYTPENVGMTAFKTLFREAKYELIVQIDDDVLHISRKIAEIAASIFLRHPTVKQLVADPIVDIFTTGGRPDMSAYSAISIEDGLYEGSVDGWFSVYHRSILPLLLDKVPYERRFYLGSCVRGLLSLKGLQGILCTKMKVFHSCGPGYSEFFGFRKFDAEKMGDKLTEPQGVLHPGQHEQLALLYESHVLELEKFGA